MRKRVRQKFLGIKCPACGEDSLVRSSDTISETLREIRLVCVDDDDCGHSFVVQVMAIRTIRPSMKAHPRVVLPLGNQNLRRCGRRPAEAAPPPPVELLMAAPG